MILSELPLEVLLLVVDKLESSGDISALARTTTTLHKQLIPSVYQFDAKRPASDALWWAARLNRERVCRNALKAGANPMANYNGDTALHIAVEHDHDQIARLLLAMPGLNPNCKGYYGFTPLMLAVNAGSLKTLRLLVADDRVDPQAVSRGVTPLIQAVMSKRIDIMRILLSSKRINPEMADPRGMSPLIWAIISNEEEAVRLLLAIPGLNVNGRDHRGLTPLMHAIQIADERIISMMVVMNKSELDRPNLGVDNQTPLIFAVRHGSLKSVAILLSAGADVNSRDDKGFTPLILAALRREAAKAALLLTVEGVDPNLHDKYGHSAYSWALRSKSEPVLTVLLEYVKKTGIPLKGMKTKEEWAAEGDEPWDTRVHPPYSM